MIATPAQTRTLPPTERDANIYRLIVTDGVSTRDVAAMAKISQTRVRQIANRVVRWLAEVLPSEVNDISPQAALSLAQSLAAERYQLFYCEAMTGWRQTGQARYANLAFRATAAQARLPVLLSTIDGLLADAQSAPSHVDDLTTDPQVTNDQGQMTNSTPPIEDCSPSQPAEPCTNETSKTTPSTTTSPPTSSDRRTLAQRASRINFFPHAELLLTQPDHPAPTATLPAVDLGFEDILRRADRRTRKPQRAK